MTATTQSVRRSIAKTLSIVQSYAYLSANQLNLTGSAWNKINLKEMNKTIIMREIYASRETNFVAIYSAAKKVKIYSLVPIDRADCECQKHMDILKKKIRTMGEKEKRA